MEDKTLLRAKPEPERRIALALKISPLLCVFIFVLGGWFHGLHQIKGHSARVLDHEMFLAPLLRSHGQQNLYWAVLEFLVFLIDVIDLKRINYHLLKVGGLAQPGCRRLKSSTRTKLNAHESKH